VEAPVPKDGCEQIRAAGRIILLAVARDWWWPWWISSLFDVGVVVLAVIVFVRANRRLVRQVAVVVGIGAIVAAGLAPVVMKGKASDSPMRMQTGNMMTTP